MKNMDPDKTNQEIARRIKLRIIQSLRSSGRQIKDFQTNQYENCLLECVTLPNKIDVGFDDIGGLDETKKSLMETILLPLCCPELFEGRDKMTKLCMPPGGILFYGPPGTGKTMTAKAIARTAKATFFDIKMSKIMSKWYGETGKYISAIFSLARKLAPSILFIDELDAFLGTRGKGTEHAVDSQTKALFLSLWDGLSSDDYSGVVVLGATNRPWDVDRAILRRLPRQYKFPMPDHNSRAKILEKTLNKIRVNANIDINQIAAKTDKFSGSDLKELCKVAASYPLREYVRDKFASGRSAAMTPERKLDFASPSSGANKVRLRILRMDDFERALKA